MKSAGKARNNGLYRHIRTSKEIIRNLLNDYLKSTSYSLSRQRKNKSHQAVYALSVCSTKSSRHPYTLTGIKAKGEDIASFLWYNPEFDSGILKDAEISASLTIL